MNFPTIELRRVGVASRQKYDVLLHGQRTCSVRGYRAGYAVLRAAIDEIERLQRENEALRRQLAGGSS